jgi:hypothetical protein
MKKFLLFVGVYLFCFTASPLQILSYKTVAPGHGLLIWSSEPCRSWVVWESSDLVNWTAGPILTNPSPTSASIVYHPVLLVTENRFYRVQSIQ